MKPITALLFGALLGLGSRVADAQDVKAERKQFRIATRSALATYKQSLGAALSTLNGELRTFLEDLRDGTVAPSDSPATISAAYDAALTSAILANFSAVGAVDDAGTLALGNLGVGVISGLTVGDGGDLDRFHDRVRKELAKFNKGLTRAAKGTLKKSRKLVPADAVLTCVVLPLQIVQLADPGPNAGVETAFIQPHPALLVGYGDASTQRISFLGVSNNAAALLLNIYDANGVLLSTGNAVPSTGIISGDTADVPAGAETPHGNVRVEVFESGNGWTFPIGY